MKNIKKKIKEILNSQRGILFAYLYGSFVTSANFSDIDIAIYLKNNKRPFKFCADLKTKLSKTLNISPDIFDLKILNDILKNPDAFSLLYLKRVLNEGRLIFNKDFESLSDFLEKYSNKYREVEALLSEVK